MMLRWEGKTRDRYFGCGRCCVLWTKFEQQDENVLPAVQGQGQGLPHRDEKRGVKECQSCKLSDFGCSKVASLVQGLDLQIGSRSPTKDLARALTILHLNFGSAVLFKWSVGINQLQSSEHAVSLNQNHVNCLLIR